MTPQQLSIPDILGYLGTPTLDDTLSAALQQAMDTLCAAVTPRSCWQSFPLNRADTGLTLAGLPLAGSDIQAHLQGCTQAVVMAVTLSDAVDRLIRTAQAQDMTQAVLLDAVAADAVEQVCESVVQEIRTRFPNCYLTERFSAGYGDFPLEMQPDLLRLLDAGKRIGLTVTQSGMLVPMKSVTALIGLSAQPTKDARRFGCGHACALCPLRDDCPHRPIPS